jgi:DNA-binding IclR family transcriptional regulator
MQPSATERHQGAHDAPDGLTTGGVDAVDRALAILQAFDVGAERMSLAALAKETGLYKSTILRLTRSLERGGFLHREPDGDFVVGSEPLRLAAIYRRSSRLESNVRAALRVLRDKTGESASFFRRLGNRRQCLYREETRRAIRDHVMEGDLLPLDVGAAGRVLRAFGGTNLTAADRARLYGLLPMTSFGERDAETAAMAVPVFSPDGLVGALTISGPRSRLTPQRMTEIGPVLVSEAQVLTRLLGGASR